MIAHNVRQANKKAHVGDTSKQKIFQCIGSKNIGQWCESKQGASQWHKQVIQVNKAKFQQHEQ